MPERIQLSRTKGWHKPPGAIIVARPSKWGNPAIIKRYTNLTVIAFPARIEVGSWIQVAEHGCVMRYEDHHEVVGIAVEWYRNHVAPLLPVHELRGRDLACWCPLDQPCHADVLLELANPAGDTGVEP